VCVLGLGRGGKGRGEPGVCQEGEQGLVAVIMTGKADFCCNITCRPGIALLVWATKPCIAFRETPLSAHSPVAQAWP
jgi:hypothetical protein